MLRRTLLISALTLAAIPSVASASSPKKKGGGPAYTQFPVITVFTRAERSRRGNLSVEMGIYASDPKLSEAVTLNMPRLRDAYVTSLQSYALNLSSKSVADTNYIATQLQAATDRILGKPGAKVLLGSVILN